MTEFFQGLAILNLHEGGQERKGRGTPYNRRYKMVDAFVFLVWVGKKGEEKGATLFSSSEEDFC